jgi:Laminin G domain
MFRQHLAAAFSSGANDSYIYKTIVVAIMIGIVVVVGVIMHRMITGEWRGELGGDDTAKPSPQRSSRVDGATVHLDGNQFAVLPSGRQLVTGERYELAFDMRVARGSFGSVVILGDPSLKAIDEQAYVAFAVVSGRREASENGRLQALVWTSLNAADLLSRDVINDGRSRNVRLKRTGDRWELMIAGVVQEAVTVPMAVMSPAEMYIGGLETFDGPTHHAINVPGIRGTVAAVKLNDTPINAFVMIDRVGGHRGINAPRVGGGARSLVKKR